MKKRACIWTALLTTAVMLAVAGGAMAYGPRYHQGGNGGGRPGWHQGFGGQRGMQGGWRNADIPQAIRDKQVEADKLRIDLRAELSRPEIDQAKALEVWKQHRALRNEIAEWFFTKRLERMASRPNETMPAPAKP